MATNCMMRSSLALLMVFLGIVMLTGCPQSLLDSTGDIMEADDVVSTAGLTSTRQVSSQYGYVVPGRILIQYRTDVKGEKAKGIIAAAGGKEVDEIASLGVSIVALPGNMDGKAQVNALLACPEVAFAELDPVAAPDFSVNDPSFSKEWHLPQIAAPAAWDITRGASTVIIAILDTGVNSLHPDLASKIVAGWNTYDNSSDTSDVNGHGTAVAGSAAACSNNGIGVASPAINCRIMPMRISDKSGLGYGSTIASALTWAANHGARVANVSFRMDFSATVKTAAQYFMSKGGVVTMSAGNESTYFASLTDNPYVLTIGATTSSDTLASFSNTGSNVDLVAPGCSIYTTTREGGYAAWSGTSLSAPVTAGVAGLVISAKPTLTGAQVQSILKQSVDDLGTSGYDTSFGWGRLNAAKAVALANPTTTIVTNPTPATDTIAPTVTITSPIANATVSGSVNVTVNATDNVGVFKVQLLVDGKYITQNLKAPFTNVWNASTATVGTHTIVCRAYDAAGNIGTSKTITVNVGTVSTTTDSIVPVVSITSPKAYATVSGSVNVTVNATDNVGVFKVQLMVDGKYVTQSLKAPFTNVWNASTATTGTHTIYCRAFDAVGNIGVSSTVIVKK